jgi:hypothetical protein
MALAPTHHPGSPQCAGTRGNLAVVPMPAVQQSFGISTVAATASAGGQGGATSGCPSSHPLAFTRALGAPSYGVQAPSYGAGTWDSVALVPLTAVQQSGGISAVAAATSARGQSGARGGCPPSHPAALNHASGVAVQPSQVVDVEVQAINRAVDALLREVPASLLLQNHSIAPVNTRMENLRESMLGYDAGSVRKGHATLLAWVAFCYRHSLTDCCAPFAADVCQWFLREEDVMALNRNAGSRRDGSSVRSSRATSLVWARNVFGIPFQATAPQVKRTSRTSLGREPAYTAMWEVAAPRHLLHMACRYRGADELCVRAYAAGAYLICMASLRQVDGLRSKPPFAVDVGGRGSTIATCFHSTASLTKGRRRNVMRPLPWWVPARSVDVSIDDSELLVEFTSIFEAMRQAKCTSMFPALVDEAGRAASMPKACGFGCGRASESRLCTSLAYLLTFSPLSMSPDEARVVARRRHGPRHTLPEVARVFGVPLVFRDELGRWKLQGGRLNRLSNGYSRDAERLLQITLRDAIMKWLFSRCPQQWARQPLSEVVPSWDEMAGLQQQMRGIHQRLVGSRAGGSTESQVLQLC